MFPKTLRIGTRKSPLALWQAKNVQQQLEQLGQATTLIPIDSEGDVNLTQPLYAMGIQGIFTKALDTALLNNKIDIAVHSLKDVPTQLPKGIILASVLARKTEGDVIVLDASLDGLPTSGIIATSSLRRKAQWLHKFPKYQVTSLRGNVQTRLQKITENQWTGALFAAAGLERLALLKSLNYQSLNWMLPAPGQGAIGISCSGEQKELITLLQQLECNVTRVCVTAERSLLRHLEGGCSAPIGTRTHLHANVIKLEAGLFSLDGKEAVTATLEAPSEQAQQLGVQLADQLRKQGGTALLNAIKNS